MSSRAGDRFTVLWKAIDEVAAAAAAATDEVGLADVAVRLAGLWAMMADLDPALAARVGDYTSGHTRTDDH